jgi:hypothetical protein
MFSTFQHFINRNLTVEWSDCVKFYILIELWEYHCPFPQAPLLARQTTYIDLESFGLPELRYEFRQVVHRRYEVGNAIHAHICCVLRKCGFMLVACD